MLLLVTGCSSSTIFSPHAISLRDADNSTPLHWLSICQRCTYFTSPHPDTIQPTAALQTVYSLLLATQHIYLTVHWLLQVKVGGFHGSRSSISNSLPASSTASLTRQRHGTEAWGSVYQDHCNEDMRGCPGEQTKPCVCRVNAGLVTYNLGSYVFSS